MSKWDVLIIGSGISSLTCAALLAKRGKSVCVLEQYNKPGGYLHCFSRFGERFETGAHYVGAMGKGQPFRALLKYLDVYDDNLFVPLDTEGFDVFNFPGFQVKFPRGYDGVIGALSAQFPQEKTAIQAYFDMIRTVVNQFPTYQFNAASDIETPTEALETSVATVVRRLTSNLKLQCVLFSYCIHHGVAPEDIPFGFHAIVTDSLIRGAYGLKNGGDAVARKFVETIEKHGGSVRLNTRVARLVTRDKHIDEVVTENGETFAADWVISGIHPKAVFGLLSEPEVLSPAFRSRVANLKESTGIFGVYAACTLDLPLNPLRNYYYFGSDNPAAYLESTTPATPGAVFVSSGTRVLRPGQKTIPVSFHASSPIEWFEPWRATAYGARPQDYRALKNELAESIFALVERYQPGLRASVRQFVTSSPLTNLHFNGSEEGSSYGIYHSFQNTGARSLGPRTHIRNLLLTGQNCLFPGLLGSAVAALRTSGHLVGIKPILNELNQEMRNFT
ncbi:MAG: NAD(P)/FAD-dependent oxidoreductase [Deltaproteobacteria bacterium]|nr:NAD(P)/FAD-dependent oxidoreductase [Deltaproteobacteria bacterium]